jgi:putative heme-binding domain-containing protein
MHSPRFFLVLLLLAAPAAARGVEPWADPKLPVTGGLELWLDAGKMEAAAKAAKEDAVAGDGKLGAWFDASGNKRHLRQPVERDRPKLIRVGDSAVVRFDGDDDHLRFTQPSGELKAFTAFLVLAPRENPGGFRGFLALNAPGGRDYETGLTIDMGPGGTPQFTQLNVEGKGFGAWKNLLVPGGPFGKLYHLEVRGDAEAKSIKVHTDGGFPAQRPWEPASLSFREITVGARYYTNGPGPQQVRGPAKADIAEIILYSRALSEDEAKKVRDYLNTKHAKLKHDLPADGGIGEVLVPVADPPPVQMLLPGFSVRQLPIDITNVNNVLYRPDGTLVALCYNGDVWTLKDTDGDDLEDQKTLFFESKGKLRGPIGMDLTPPGYKYGEGVCVASKGKVSLIVDTDGDGRSDKEIIVADGWKDIIHSVDALGVAFDPKDQSIIFGRGTANFAGAYLIDKDGKAHYDLRADYGTIIRVAPDLKSRKVVATGIRFPVGIRFNKAGDLFCTDQEGATWLPNGNPFDELLHIRLDKVRHYGFPPRHPKHLPDVIDEPSTFDYSPQHQSTCGFCFNKPVKNDGPIFGPKSWAGDAIVTGESRGKLYRTQLVKTDAGYIAKSQIIACLNMLTVDCCVTPDGSLLVACHSGGPDWGTGPTGKGKLYKISYTDHNHPQPVLVYPSGPREVRVEFDRPVDPQLLHDVLKQTKLTAGQYVRAGDRFESLWPGYAVVQMQKSSPRFNVPVHSAQLTPDRRTLVLATDPLNAAVHYALTLPRMGRPAKDATPKGTLPQHPQIDLDFDLSGVEVAWYGNGSAAWFGWLPCVDLEAARRFTAGSATHDALWASYGSGSMTFKTQCVLASMLRPAVQPGSKIDHEWPEEEVTLAFEASGTLKATSGLKDTARLSIEGKASQSSGRLTDRPRAGETIPVEFRLDAPLLNSPRISLSYQTNEDETPRPLPLRRILLPWADTKADLAKPQTAMARPKELDGGSWARGRKIFFGETAACSKCHAVSGQGGAIGPDLANLIHRDYASVYRDIAQPSFALNPDFIPQTIQFADGRTIAGVVRTIDGKLHIGDKDGKTTIADRNEIESMRPSAVSVMPDDLVKKLGPEQTRDLLTFLLTEPPSMPRDYKGTEKRPKPRTVAEVNAILAGAPNPPEKPRAIRVALVAGPKDHGPGEHDYPAWQKAWKELLAAADNIEVATAWEWPAKDEFQKADVMVFYQHGDWNGDRAADIDAFLDRGGGLVYIHWAVDGRKDAEGFAKRIGLAAKLIKFRHGPLDLEFNKDRPHPVARNFNRLAMVDESYWKMTGNLAKDRVIAWGKEDNEPQPLFWSREHGKGRVFVSIPGHFSWSFDDPLFRVLLLRGIAWSAKEPVDRFNDLVWPGADVAK